MRKTIGALSNTLIHSPVLIRHSPWHESSNLCPFTLSNEESHNGVSHCPPSLTDEQHHGGLERVNLSGEEKVNI